MKKVTQVTMHYFPPSGGQDVYVQQLIDCLEKIDVSSSVIQPAKTFQNRPSHVFYTPRIPFIGKLFMGSNWFWFNAMLHLKKQFLKKQDIVISHYPFHYNPLSFHNKVIVVSHGVDWPENPKRIFNIFKKNLAQKLKIEANSNEVAIVANDSEFLRKIGINIQPGNKFFSEIKPNIWLIPNAINTDNLKCRVNDKPENFILVPRNIRKSRGIDLSIKAFNKLSTKKEFKNFKLKIAGGPLNGSYYKECKNLASSNVVFLGNIPRKKLLKLYQKAHLTLIPTRDFEGTSLAAIEAMTSGSPVVSTDIGGLKDLPTYKSRVSSKALAEAIEHVIKNRHKYAIQQQKETINTFNMTNWCKAWQKVIQSY